MIERPDYKRIAQMQYPMRYLRAAGAGCAGSVAAYELARSGKSVLLIERGNYAGAKNMTGGRIYSHSLAKVFQDFEQEAPLERKITHEKMSLLAPDACFTVDFSSEAMLAPA